MIGDALGTAYVPSASPPATVGVIVTPVTLPVTKAFCFLLVVPRAMRVAFAFAVAAARFAAESGTYAFLGVISNAVSVFS